MHSRFYIHLCTGLLISTTAVMTCLRCVTRKKSIGGKVSHHMVGRSSIVVMAGSEAMSPSSKHILIRAVRYVITPHEAVYKGNLGLLTVDKIPYTMHHRPIKMYSTDLGIIGRKLQEYARHGFCDVVTWDETLICSKSFILRPTVLKAYRVRVLDSARCKRQSVRFGWHSSGDWVDERNRNKSKHCFEGMGGIRCGTAPGAVLVCGDAVFGLMTVGSSCSEFGDYSMFVPLNDTDVEALYEQLLLLEEEKYHGDGVAIQINVNLIITQTSLLLLLYCYLVK